jgi:SAM-dependent methyltransferase
VVELKPEDRAGAATGYSAYSTAELAEAYDAAYTNQHDLDFWRIFAAAAAGPLVELGCGTGRVLLPLARAGHEITGVDLSPWMLDRCRDKLAGEPEAVRARVSLAQADMTSFELDRQVSGILCAFNSFHHLRTADEQLACLERCREHLRADGLLALDLFNPDPAPDGAGGEEQSAGRAVSEIVEWTQGRHLSRTLTCEYDRLAQCNECTMTYRIVESDGATRELTETFPLRLIFRFELEHLLARAGFRVLEIYGDYDRSPFRETSVGMIVLATPREAGG